MSSCWQCGTWSVAAAAALTPPCMSALYGPWLPLSARSSPLQEARIKHNEGRVQRGCQFSPSLPRDAAPSAVCISAASIHAVMWRIV